MAGANGRSSKTGPTKAKARVRASAGTATVEHLVSTIESLDRAGKHHGLVPLPELRRAMKLEPDAFNKLVLGAERDFKIDLKIAHDPMSIAPALRAQGIKGYDAGRQAERLYYYAVVR